MSNPDTFDPVKRSNVFFQSDKLRVNILIAYWVVVIITVPLWWKITSIERLQLPTTRVNSLDPTQTLRFPLHLTFQQDVEVPGFSKSHFEFAVSRKARSDPHWTGLDVHVVGPSHHNVSDPFYIEFSHDSERSSHVLSDNGLKFNVAVNAFSLHEAVNILSQLVAPYDSFRLEADHQRVIKYSPKFRLAFTLMNEEATPGYTISSWDIERALSGYLSPALRQLELLHEFIIESQVQFSAPLAFQPQLVDRSHEESFSAATPEDLKTFVNSAEWTLSSSVSNDPVLHFILFIPSREHRPMHVLDNDGRIASSNAFIIPQWGGIVIFNPPQSTALSHLDKNILAPIFGTFRLQLLSLLGVAQLPRSVSFEPETTRVATDPLTKWQLYSLLRARTQENTRTSIEALRSIVRLVDKIDNMPVKEDVRSQVIGALAAIDKVKRSTADTSASLVEIFAHSREANVLSSQAFFNPGMLAMLYFPAEHTYAVYLPLFAPIGVPLLFSVFRELARWRKERKEKQRRKLKGKDRMEGERTRVDG